MIQDKIFETTEADNWFLRNKDSIVNQKAENDLISSIVDKIFNKNEIKSVIELGASNGYRLNFLKKELLNCKEFVGVDVSRAAVEDGKSRYGLEMYQSGLDNFTLDKKFDLVIVNFVFHWIDRENIFNAIANTDKLINDGGYLVLGDFLPDFPQKRKYHHLPEENIFTYKTDYSKTFESLNTYKELYRITRQYEDHKSVKINFASSDDRCFCSVLRKDLYGYYYEN